jgi:hypothetical protein
MRQEPIIISVSVVIMFILLKILYSKFIKETIAFKKIFTDSIFVFVSTMLGIFIVEQVSDGVDTKSTFAFTSNPDF